MHNDPFYWENFVSLINDLNSCTTIKEIVKGFSEKYPYICDYDSIWIVFKYEDIIVCTASFSNKKYVVEIYNIDDVSFNLEKIANNKDFLVFKSSEDQPYTLDEKKGHIFVSKNITVCPINIDKKIINVLLVSSSKIPKTQFKNGKTISFLAATKIYYQYSSLYKASVLKKKTIWSETVLSNIRHGIISFDQDLKIENQFSKKTLDILDLAEEDLSGSDLIKTIFGASLVADSQIQQVKAALSSIIGEDKISYQLNEHLLITRFDRIGINKEKRHISLDWTPIEDNSIVVKMMLIIRDITKQIISQEENKKMSRKNRIIIELSKINQEMVIKFLGNTGQLLESSFNFLKDEAEAGKCKKELMRNLHTIKGNSRTYSFIEISDLTHKIESLIIDKDLSQATKYCERLKQVLQFYCDTNKEIFENDKTISRPLNNVEISYEDSDEKKVETINELIVLRDYVALEVAVENEILSLEGIAKDLGKVTPKVVFNGSKIAIIKHFQSLFKDVMGHCLKNSVDHGLESPDEQRKAGKDQQGLIMISVRVIDSHRIELYLEDNGRGINIAFLKKKFSSTDLSNVETANLIFESGVSTKNQVGEISGRGVGMNAVKSLLLREGCDIEIILGQEKSLGFFGFKFKMTLNVEYYNYNCKYVL